MIKLHYQNYDLIYDLSNDKGGALGNKGGDPYSRGGTCGSRDH